MSGLEIDHIILVCKGCGGERSIYPDRPLRGAEELIEWLKTKPTQCACGATHCDVKAHLKGGVGKVKTHVKVEPEPGSGGGST